MRMVRKSNLRPISTLSRVNRPIEKYSAQFWTLRRTPKESGSFYSAAKAPDLNFSNLEHKMLVTSAINQITRPLLSLGTKTTVSKKC